MGEYFSLEDPMSLVEKIIRLVEDPARRKRLGKGLWEKAKREYVWDRVAEKTIQVYKEILGLSV